MVKKKPEKKKTLGDHILTIILVIAIGVFCYAGYNLFTIYMEYKAGTDEYNEIAQLAVTVREDADISEEKTDENAGSEELSGESQEKTNQQEAVEKEKESDESVDADEKDESDAVLEADEKDEPEAAVDADEKDKPDAVVDTDGKEESDKAVGVDEKDEPDAAVDAEQKDEPDVLADEDQKDEPDATAEDAAEQEALEADTETAELVIAFLKEVVKAGETLQGADINIPKPESETVEIDIENQEPESETVEIDIENQEPESETDTADPEPESEITEKDTEKVSVPESKKPQADLKEKDSEESLRSIRQFFSNIISILIDEEDEAGRIQKTSVRDMYGKMLQNRIHEMILRNSHPAIWALDCLVDNLRAVRFSQELAAEIRQNGPSVQAPLEIDFEVLQEINEDVIGWIYMEALDTINYPMVRGEDNDKYLHHTYEGKYNFAGTIFIDYENSRDFSDCNTIVYGHNMKNGSMFGKLKEYVSKPETYEKSKYFWILTPKADYRYEIVAAYTTKVNSDTYTFFSSPGEKFLDYLDKIRSWSAIKTSSRKLTVRDKVVTLSTCTGNDATRFVVQGVRVDTVPK